MVLKKEIWTWKDYGDLSGHLEAPNGQQFFIYDWTTKEYKVNEHDSWDSFVDADPTRDTSFTAFKEYAQNFIFNNIVDKEKVYIAWHEEKILSYEEKLELGSDLKAVFERNSLSMNDEDKAEAIALLNKGADATESLIYVSNDANMFENCHWLIQTLKERNEIENYFSDKNFANEIYERAKDSVLNDKESWTDVQDIGISGFMEIAEICSREEEANTYYDELLKNENKLTDLSGIRKIRNIKTTEFEHEEIGQIPIEVIRKDEFGYEIRIDTADWNDFAVHHAAEDFEPIEKLADGEIGTLSCFNNFNEKDLADEHKHIFLNRYENLEPLKRFDAKRPGRLISFKEKNAYETEFFRQLDGLIKNYDANLHNLNGEEYTTWDIEQSVKLDLQNIFDELNSNENSEVKNLILNGVKLYKNPETDKLSVLAEFESINKDNRWSEDGLFNAISEYAEENEVLNLNGVTIDVNPITPEKSGTIPEYMAKLNSWQQKDTRDEINNKFNKELSDFIDGKLDKNHIFNLGLPGEILKNCGFPENGKITMSAARLETKAKLARHTFNYSEIYNLSKALNKPIAVFDYGFKENFKAKNVIINITKNEKQYLAGIHFTQLQRGIDISSIRTLFPKDNNEWLQWINQGKMIYGDKEKLQALIAQQRMNGADVNKEVVQGSLDERCLESVESIMQNFTDVKDIFTKNYPFYSDVKKKASIEQKFYNHYVEKGNLDARILAENESTEFYTALVNNDIETINEYTKTDLHEISEIANRIKIEYFAKILQEVEFKKDKGIKNDSEVLENPTNERSSLPNKNIQDIDSDVNKISETSISYMPHREVINNAKAARAMYVNPILKGEKKGLWKAFNDFKRHGVFEIQGKNVATDKNGHLTENGFKQLATAMDIYRDKRFESARYVFIDKDGNIKDQLALSTFMPNQSISKLDETFEQVLRHAQKTDTKVAFVHNHPSGNIEASLDDKRFTSNLEEYLNRNGKDLFAGHIILDHNTFNCYEPGKNWNEVKFADIGKDQFEKENIPEFAKKKIDTVENLKDVAKSINDENEYNKNWIPVVFVKADSTIGGVEYFSKDYFTLNKSEDIYQDFQNIGRLCGSDKAIPVVPNELSYDEKLHSEMINKFRDGCFYDIALGNRTAKDLNLTEYSSGLFAYTNKEMQLQTKIETTFELPKVDKREIGISQKVAENQTFYKRENIQPVDLRSYIANNNKSDVFDHRYFVDQKFVPPFVFAENNCYIRCNAKDLRINSALKLNPEKKVDVIVSKKQFAQIIADEKLKEKLSKLEEHKKTNKPITPIVVASAKMTPKQEELILAQNEHLNFTERKLTYTSMYKEVMTDVSKIEADRQVRAATIIDKVDKEFEQLKKDYIQKNGTAPAMNKVQSQESSVDY